MIESETSRKVRKEPAMVANVDRIADLFPFNTTEKDEAPRDLISELWVF